MTKQKLLSILAISLSLAAFGCDDSSSHEGTDSGVVDSGVDSGVHPDAGQTDDAGVDAGDPCVGEDGCYACTPTDGNSIQFLNHCTEEGVDCAPFDNSRIPAP